MIEVERVITEMYRHTISNTARWNFKSSHKLESNNSNTVVVTIFENPDDWWKIEKTGQSIHVHRYKVLYAKVLDSCFLDTGPNDKIAVLIREYIDGQDLDSLFSTTQLSHEEWDHLLGSLGTVLGQIHRVKFPTFGLIKDWKIVGSMNRSAPAAVKWIDFYDDMMAGAETFLGSLADKKIGTLTNKDLNVIFKSSKSVYQVLNKYFEGVTEPRLTHNDARFANFIVSQQVTSIPRELAGVIDFEWSLAGDPDIDLVQIENWLNLVYTPLFLEHKNSFAYLDQRKPSHHYSYKRQIYHMYRSIEYLNAILVKLQVLLMIKRRICPKAFYHA